MRRPAAIAAGIGAVVVGSAAAGYLVTSLGPGGGLARAGECVVDLMTTLDSGATVAGTGVILTASGEVVTSYHAVNGAISIAAEVAVSGRRYAATTFALDPTDDVAVLQLLNATGLPSAGVGDSSRVAVGDHVTAIGNASGRGGAPADSQGAVVALGQTIIAAEADGANPQTLDGLIEFSAPLPVAAAGGPLVDTSGKMVGLDTAGAGRVQLAPGTAGVGYAIPVARVIAIVHDVDTHTQNRDILQANGAFLGVNVGDSLSPPGALVVTVGPGTPALVAGIVAGDVITSVNGAGVASMEALRDQLRRHHGGDRVVVGWIDPQGHLHSATTQLAVATFS